MPYDRIAHKPNSFLALFEPKSSPVEASRPTSPLDFRINIQTSEYAITLAYGEREMLTVSPDGQQILLLAGNIYRPQSADTGRAILDLYARQGLDFVEALNGTFSLILVDTSTDQIAIATDRINSSKVLIRWDGETLIASNSIYLQPVRRARLDRVAVASYLAVGYIYNDRTLFEDIHTLDAASIYRLADGKLTQHRYWQYLFAPPSKPESPESLRQEMSDRLVEAVRIRIPDDRPTYLSLSGGYDSSAVLGILANNLHVPDVHCFSYTYGEARPGSDEYIAGLMAEICGYRHQNIPAFDGDAARTLRRNGHLGGAMIQVCDEVDAWVTLGKNVKGGPMPVLFTGDTPIVRHDMEIKAVADAVYSAGLGNFSVADWSKKVLGGTLYDEFVAATRAEVERAIAHAAPTHDLYALRDTIYLEQYVSHRIGNWREYFAGRFFTVAIPILDNNILDLMMRVPTPLRRGKRLYIDTVTTMFPQLYSRPLATSASYATYWLAAAHQQGLRTLIEGQASPLDDVIEPDILLGLLDSGLRPRSLVHRLASPAVLKAFHRIEHLSMGQAVFTRMSHLGDKVTPRTFLLRALTLRSFAAEMTDSDSTSVD